jgi:hypothetical protein
MITQLNIIEKNQKMEFQILKIWSQFGFHIGEIRHMG